MPNNDENFSVDEILAEISAGGADIGDAYITYDEKTDGDSAGELELILSGILDDGIKEQTFGEPEKSSEAETAKSFDGGETEKPELDMAAQEALAQPNEAQRDLNGQKDQDGGFKLDIEKYKPKSAKAQPETADFSGRRGDSGFEEDLSEELSCDDMSLLGQEEISEILVKRQRSAKISAVITGIIALFAVVIELLNMLPGVTPDIISAAASPAVYGAVGLILLALGTLAAYKPFVYGLTALFKLKANRFSLTSLAALGCLVQNVVLVISPPQELYSGNTHVYSAIALCGLAFACFSYQTVVENAVVSFKPAFSRYDKYGAVIMKEEYSSAYTKGLIYDAPVLAFCKKAGKINNFAGRAFSSDMTDSVSAKLAPFVGAAAVILGAAVGYSMKSVSVGFTVFAAIAVVSAPFTYTLGSALVMKKTVNRLVRLGATIVGSGGADYYSCLNSITIPAKALFPEDSILLRGIKTFGSTRIDEAIVSAASVACAGESILTDLFMQIVSGKKDMLRPAEGLCYEDGCGLSAWVNKKRVLIGTRELMLSHGVDAPSKDYEEKYTDENNDLIYLSVGGELSAVFIIGLVADAAVAHALRMLEYRDISIVIDTSDPVVTAGRVSALFGVDEEVLKILPSRLKDELARAGEYTDEVYSGVISNGTVCSFAAAVCEAKKLRSSFMLLTVIHLASMLAGLAMIAVFAFMRDFTQLTTSMLLIYQCMWSAFSIIAAKVK